jgi:DNA-binding MarR family transcriptional regulator
MGNTDGFEPTTRDLYRYDMTVSPAAPARPARPRRDPATREVLELFGEIAKAFYDEYDEAAGSQDLTRMQAFVLASLVDGPKPMRRLAEILKCEPSNITGLVDRMETRGLVTRESDPVDRRVKNITATELGQVSYETVWSGLKFAAAPLSALSDDERTVLRDLLRRVAAAV